MISLCRRPYTHFEPIPATRRNSLLTMKARIPIFPVAKTRDLAPIGAGRARLSAEETNSDSDQTTTQLASVFDPAEIEASVSFSEGKVLIVDDDPAVRRALRTTLQTLGFHIAEAASGEEALERLHTAAYDVVLLDINMPGINGLETCRELRRLFLYLPILMLSVRDSEDDKVKALDAGADDYVTKPFHIRELIARVRAAVRRVRTLEKDARAAIRIGKIELDPARREVYKAGEILRLTPKEFDLLHYLMAHAGVPIAHARLLNAVWGSEYRDEVEYLRTFVRQLRKKIEDDPANPKYVLTDLQFGYRFLRSDLVDTRPLFDAWAAGERCAEGD
jgi:two-component system KDP operon response regulator KdpE